MSHIYTSTVLQQQCCIKCRDVPSVAPKGEMHLSRTMRGAVLQATQNPTQKSAWNDVEAALAHRWAEIEAIKGLRANKFHRKIEKLSNEIGHHVQCVTLRLTSKFAIADSRPGTLPNEF